MNGGKRTFDLVLFGATGFTGKLVAEYLATHAKDLSWAIAGRNQRKLEEVRDALGLAGLPVRVADSQDAVAIDALTKETRVVCTTVGPYAVYGKTLVDACAANGTHYCDITGEVPFVRASIDDNHERAKASGARIVHFCGFDSIPFDLGVHMLWDAASRRPLRWAKGYCGRMKGGSFSGGTAASMINLVEESLRDPRIRKLAGDPHALDPDPRAAKRDPRERDRMGVRFDPDLPGWTAPFLMAAVNTRVVRRSNALIGYGPSFVYTEAMSLPAGPRGVALGAAIAGGLGAFIAGAVFPPTRALLQRFVLPAPGEGPSKEKRESGWFEVHVLAETEDGEKLRGYVKGTSDPGYGETAKMLGESALCLAKDDLTTTPGVLTPASAMGMRLVERLRAAGMTWTV